MNINSGQTILFTGDSITDCERARPVGRGGALGDGYVAFVDSLLASSYPERHITVLNTGISGNRVIDLEERWQEDVLDLAPDWLSVKIGINDVWRHFDNESDPNQVGVDRYTETYRKVLAQTRPQLKGLTIISPYLIEADTSDPMRKQMDEYGGVAKQLAGEFDAVFVDAQAAFDRYLVHRTSESLSEDRVHPNRTGHMIIAKAFLTAMDFDWNAG